VCSTPALLGALALALTGCGEAPNAVERGEQLFRESKLSSSPFNTFSCASCHSCTGVASGVAVGRFDAGFDLAGSVARESFWGGYETRLLDAINVCVDRFMGGRALGADDESARELYAYLDSLAPTDALPALPFTVVRDATSLPELVGDPANGSVIYRAACSRCHGAAHTGAGRSEPRASVIPEETQKSFQNSARAVVVEKIRHGKFFNIGGVMPLYAREVLSDAEVADILAYLEL
jgi:thiosulfate dehydrogenase